MAKSEMTDPLDCAVLMLRLKLAVLATGAPTALIGSAGENPSLTEV